MVRQITNINRTEWSVASQTVKSIHRPSVINGTSMTGTNSFRLAEKQVEGLTNDYNKVIDTSTLVISIFLGSDVALTDPSMLSKLVRHA